MGNFIKVYPTLQHIYTLRNSFIIKLIEWQPRLSQNENEKSLFRFLYYYPKLHQLLIQFSF